MQDKLRIPKRCKVGFQKRKDTYRGKLAFVISAGRSKDPRSWLGWIESDIPVQEFDNVPTEGFVLNRDVGGVQRGRCDWNARRERVRVYDPRDFEFEITVENVLLILQECSSIKGKGLEGQFVLAWAGKHIVLLPVTSQEYKTSVEFINLGAKKIPKADIQEGCTYLTKDKVNVLYLGRHPWFDETRGYSRYGYKSLLRGQKRHVFLNLDWVNKNPLHERTRECYQIESGFAKLAHKTSDTPVPQYAEEYQKLMATTFVSTPKELVIKPARLKEVSRYQQPIGIVDHDTVWFGFLAPDYQRSSCSYYRTPDKFLITCKTQLAIRNGELVQKDCNHTFHKDDLTLAEVQTLAKDVYIKCENDKEYLYA